MRFAKFSLRTAYAVLITAMVLVMAILSVIHMIRTLNSTTFEVQGKQINLSCSASLIPFWLTRSVHYKAAARMEVQKNSFAQLSARSLCELLVSIHIY